jgi:hypothetical protein
VELLDGVDLLARPDEPDGCAGDLADGEGGAAAGVGVELGQDDAVDLELIVEGLGGVDGVLAGHGIDDEEDLVGLDAGIDAAEFAHEVIVDVQATGGIEDEDIGLLLACRDEGAPADIDGDADRLAVGRDLVAFGVEAD